MKQGIVGLCSKCNGSCKAHMLIALPHIQLRGKNQITLFKFTFIYHLVHQSGKNDSVRSHRQMCAVLLRSGCG